MDTGFTGDSIEPAPGIGGVAPGGALVDPGA